MITILGTALPVFLAIFIGMLCRSRGILSRENIDGLKKVVLNITLPAVLINAFATAEYTVSALVLPVLIFALCSLALFLGFGITKLFRIPGKLVPYLASGFEAGMLGYALFSILFPQVSTSKLALLDIGHTLFVFTLYKVMLSGEKNPRRICKDLVSSPVIWAVIVGVLLGATGFYGKLGQWGISGILDAATSFVSAPTAMVILLTVGYDLVPKEIPWKKTFGLIAMRLSVMAVMYGILTVLNRTLLNGVIFEGAVVILLILPPPYVIPVFADEPAERVQISSALSAMTLLTIILFAVYAVVLAI